MSEHHRAVLGVGPGAGADEIRAAYRSAAKRAHPDMGGSSAAFQRVRTAADSLLADLEAGHSLRSDRRRGDDDRASRKGLWTTVSAELRDIWGLTGEPAVAIAPQKIGLSPFVTDLGLNLPAYDWLVRTIGPRGEGWDFHSAGSVTRIFFRGGDDARLFQMRFF